MAVLHCFHPASFQLTEDTPTGGTTRSIPGNKPSQLVKESARTGVQLRRTQNFSDPSKLPGDSTDTLQSLLPLKTVGAISGWPLPLLMACVDLVRRGAGLMCTLTDAWLSSGGSPSSSLYRGVIQHLEGQDNTSKVPQL